MVASVLIASMDAHVRLGLTEQLTQMGWTCVEAQSPEECKQIAADCAVHAAVIDAGSIAELPVFSFPVIRIDGNAEGETPSLARPVKLATLVALLSQALSMAGDEVTVKTGWRLLPAERMLMHAGTNLRVALTDKERDLLLCLSRAGDAGVTREKLLEQVWGYAEGAATHTVETHIHRLRSKIRDAKIEDELIETLSEGYRVA